MGRVSKVARLCLLIVAMFFLFLALRQGLVRLGWNWTWLASESVLDHGPFMVCGFLGTLISLERAVALDRWWAYFAPVATGIGALFLAGGAAFRLGILLIVLGSAGLVALLGVVIAKQPRLFTLTMALGAGAWFSGNVCWLAGVPIPGMVHWWIGFLILTIVGERLELSRFLAPSRHMKLIFSAALCSFLAGLGWASFVSVPGYRITGAGMILFAAWLVRYDVARYTILQSGLPRYIAACLYAGYAWLGIGGLIWICEVPLERAGSPSYLVYDAALHSIFLGFVFSMIFAHAPIIFPAITGRPLLFRRIFYLHAIVLQLSLLGRVTGDVAGSLTAYRWGGLLNGAAILMFLASSVYGMVSARRATVLDSALH